EHPKARILDGTATGPNTLGGTETPQGWAPIDHPRSTWPFQRSTGCARINTTRDKRALSLAAAAIVTGPPRTVARAGRQLIPGDREWVSPSNLANSPESSSA